MWGVYPLMGGIPPYGVYTVPHAGYTPPMVGHIPLWRYIPLWWYTTHKGVHHLMGVYLHIRRECSERMWNAKGLTD